MTPAPHIDEILALQNAVAAYAQAVTMASHDLSTAQDRREEKEARQELLHLILRQEASARQRQDVIEALASALGEAVTLMDDVRTGNYTPDTFTAQPWNEALKAAAPHRARG